MIFRTCDTTWTWTMVSTHLTLFAVLAIASMNIIQVECRECGTNSANGVTKACTIDRNMGGCHGADIGDWDADSLMETSTSRDCVDDGRNSAHRSESERAVTLVTAAVDVGRTAHYGGTLFSFQEDYLEPLRQLMGKGVPLYIFMSNNKEHVDFIRPFMHDKVYLRFVNDSATEFPHTHRFPKKGFATDGTSFTQWQQRQERDLDRTVSGSSACSSVPFTSGEVGDVQWVHFLKPYWLREASRHNPFTTSTFLWIDNNLRCLSWMQGAVSYGGLLNRLYGNDNNSDNNSNTPSHDRMLVFGAKQRLDEKSCVGGTPFETYSRDFVTTKMTHKTPSLDILVRGLLFGGTASAIDTVWQHYDDYLANVMATGTWVFSEESILTALYHQQPCLFKMVPTFDNIISANLETATCWPKQLIMKDRPRLEVTYPSPDEIVNVGSTVFAFKVENWRLGALYGDNAGSGHRGDDGEIPLTSMGTICMLITEQSRSDGNDDGDHQTRDAAFSNVDYNCILGDQVQSVRDDPDLIVWPHGGIEDMDGCSNQLIRSIELLPGEYTIRAELCYGHGQPVSASERVNFTVHAHSAQHGGEVEPSDGDKVGDNDSGSQSSKITPLEFWNYQDSLQSSTKLATTATSDERERNSVKMQRTRHGLFIGGENAMWLCEDMISALESKMGRVQVTMFIVESDILDSQGSQANGDDDVDPLVHVGRLQVQINDKNVTLKVHRVRSQRHMMSYMNNLIAAAIPSFDIIHIDGRVIHLDALPLLLRDSYDLLKVGGMLAGACYYNGMTIVSSRTSSGDDTNRNFEKRIQWTPIQTIVDTFAQRMSMTTTMLRVRSTDDPIHPSWWMIKTGG